MVANEVAVNVAALLTIVPLAVLSVKSLVPPEEIVPALAKPIDVAEVEIVSSEATPVETLKALEAIANVPVALPIEVLAVPEVLIEAVPPEIVNPADPVSNPDDVMVPVLDVEI